MKDDEIHIENLECFAYHGVNPEENEKGQYFYVNAILYTDIRPAALNDDLTKTANYSEVAKFIYGFMVKNTYNLIETVAEKLAREILLNFPLVTGIDLEIRKPHAPVKLNFSSVSVKITRAWRQVFVATGSNLGDSKQIIKAAIAKMASHPQMRKLKASEFFISAPYGMTGQPDFVNGTVMFETLLPPEELLGYLKGLEQAAGRKPGGGEKNVRWESRTLDLDILLYEDIIMAEERLTIPHPDLHNRDFVLTPLLSLAPCLRHPLLNRPLAELLDGLPKRYVKKTAE